MGNKEPFIECDWEYPCQCNESDIQGEWEWDESEEVWKCSSCGDIQ